MGGVWKKHNEGEQEVEQRKQKGHDCTEDLQAPHRTMLCEIRRGVNEALGSGVLRIQNTVWRLLSGDPEPRDASLGAVPPPGDRAEPAAGPLPGSLPGAPGGSLPADTRS